MAYNWKPLVSSSNVTWDSSRTVVIIKLRRTSALDCIERPRALWQRPSVTGRVVMKPATGTLQNIMIFRLARGPAELLHDSGGRVTRTRKASNPSCAAAAAASRGYGHSDCQIDALRPQHRPGRWWQRIHHSTASGQWPEPWQPEVFMIK